MLYCSSAVGGACAIGTNLPEAGCAFQTGLGSMCSNRNVNIPMAVGAINDLVFVSAFVYNLQAGVGQTATFTGGLTEISQENFDTPTNATFEFAATLGFGVQPKTSTSSTLTHGISIPSSGHIALLQTIINQP